MKTKIYRELILHPDVRHCDEIRKYSPGLKVEKEGLFTERFTAPQYYSLEVEALACSLVLGKQLVDSYLSARKTLYFEYSE